MEETEEEWRKPRNVLKMLGYTAIVIGVTFGVIDGVLYLIPQLTDVSFESLTKGLKLPTMRAVLYMLVAGGICLADLKILEKLEEKQINEWKYAIMIALTSVSVVSLVAGFFIFDIGGKSGNVNMFLWEFAGCFMQFVLKLGDRRRTK